MSRRSAVIVRIRVGPALERLRRRHDPLAVKGVPAHVTLLFPFLPTAELTPAVRATLAGIAAAVPSFVVRFARVERFPDAVWLAPEPDRPFRELTERIEAAYPDHPPYGGVHSDVIPHLTIGLGSGPELDRLARLVDSSPPFTAYARAIEVIAEDGSDRWRRHWRLALGSTAPA